MTRLTGITANGNAARKCVKIWDTTKGILSGFQKEKLKTTRRAKNTAINGRNDSDRKEELIWAWPQRK